MKPEEKYPWLSHYDEMPVGWRIAFGEQMLEELNQAIDNPDEYYVLEIKEKYGSLCWYDMGGNEKTDEIIQKYEILSKNICIHCGMPDVPMVMNGWLSPFCGSCYGISHSDDDYLAAVWNSEILMPDEHRSRWTLYPGDTRAEVVCDISETADIIRRRYEEKERIKNERSEQDTAGA